MSDYSGQITYRGLLTYVSDQAIADADATDETSVKTVNDCSLLFCSLVSSAEVEDNLVDDVSRRNDTTEVICNFSNVRISLSLSPSVLVRVTSACVFSSHQFSSLTNEIASTRLK